MRSRSHMVAMLGAALLGPLLREGAEVLPSPQPPAPPRDRTVRDQVLSKQRKREKIKAAQLLKAGISGSKLSRKAARGKL